MSKTAVTKDAAPKAAKDKGAAPTYYLFHGNDDFTRAAEVDSMIAKIGDAGEAEMNTARFQGKDADVTEILAAAQSMPFLCDRRLVIVEGYFAWNTRKGAGAAARGEIDRLVAALPTLPEWARVVFSEPDELPKTSPLMKLLQSDTHGFVKLFNLPERDIGRFMSGWITRRAALYDATIEPPAAVILGNLIGADLHNADTEIDKLAVYVGGTRAINEDDVALLIAGAPESTMFQLVDYMGARRARDATLILHRLLDAHEEPLALLGMINRQFRLLLQIKSHVEAGGDTRALMELLGLRDWQRDSLLRQAGNFSLADLEAIYRGLLDIDFKIKTGQIGGALAIDLLIADLAQ